jgi:cyclomaltodextrinase / maltogenic alpha-amylase / neopullulanase
VSRVSGTSAARDGNEANKSGTVTAPGWVAHVIWWQIYPLGFVGAYPAQQPPSRPAEPDEHRLRRVVDWLDHAVELGASGLALGPVFASRTHGYDTTDHYRVDPRLGDDADFDLLIGQAHRRGLRVLLDGVFNHVGTEFPQYLAALDGDSPGHHEAARWFRGQPGQVGTFEGHDDLIALDHDNPAVADYVVDVMSHWLDRGADGWRLDAAYAVPERFWAQVLPRVRDRHPGAWFVGEVIHGDYPAMVSGAGFDSVTQYELWKAIWSGLNDGNFHELDHALKRHNEFLDTFAPLTFIGNHDVTRIASQLTHPAHPAQALVILMTTGGVPSVYAGDELGFQGVKEERFGGDDAVRPEFGSPPLQVDAAGAEMFSLHQYLIGLRRRHPWLHTARTKALLLDNRRYVYETRTDDDSLIVALNVGDEPMQVRAADLGGRRGVLIAGTGAPPEEEVGDTVVPPQGWLILRPA